MSRHYHWRSVAYAALALLALCLLDFVVPAGGWYSAHPMTASAIATVLGFLAATIFLEEWLRERESARLRLVSTVAYRGLAQSANDAGRTLLAPLSGADLYSLGIPGASSEQRADDLLLLRNRGHNVSFAQNTGSWRTDRTSLQPVLRDLLNDEDFVQGLFRRVATVRRRLQEATALWAPVMLTSTRTADDLGRMRTLSDALEMLQEQLRQSGHIARDARPVWKPDAAWVDQVEDTYWSAIDTYERIRDKFGDLAELPSDAIVRRHG